MIVLMLYIAIESNCWGIKKRVIKTQQRNKTLFIFYFIFFFLISLIAHTRKYYTLEANSKAGIRPDYNKKKKTLWWMQRPTIDTRTLKKWREDKGGQYGFARVKTQNKAENWYSRLVLNSYLPVCLFIALNFIH